MYIVFVLFPQNQGHQDNPQQMQLGNVVLSCITLHWNETVLNSSGSLTDILTMDLIPISHIGQSSSMDRSV